jgi:hypothetical protein
MFTGKAKTPTPSAPDPSVDWRRVVSTACLKCDWTALAKAALGSNELAAMVGEAFRAIGRSIEHDIAHAESATPPQSPPDPPTSQHRTDDEPPGVGEPENHAPVVIDAATAEAAALLGVAVDANADEIRAALRARLTASRLHPDQGGDAEEAKRLIAAKNFLIERARAVRA